MIKLYQFAPIWGLPNGSPFCLKLEMYLRLAKIPYEVVTLYDPRKAPKGKLPYIQDGGKTVADSSLIILYLKEKYGDVLDGHLSAEQKAIALSVQHLLEEHLFWIVFHERWVEEKGWKVIKNDFFGSMPLPLRWFVPAIIRRSIVKICYGQGVGRFSEAERSTLGKADIDAIVTLLGNNTFFFGEQYASIDATLWGFLTLILNTPVPSLIGDYARTFPALVAYDKRMRVLFDGVS
jgi:glutathione S-transferase